MSVALAPAQNLSRDLSTRFNHAQRAVVKFGHDQQRRVDLGVRTLRDVSLHLLSLPTCCVFR